MKFGPIFRFELGYQLRSPAMWFYIVLLFLGPMAMVQFSDPTNNRVMNTPQTYSEVTSMVGFLALFVSAGLFGDAATRDSATRSQSLFNTAPITKWDYLGGRFAAVFLLNALLLLGLPLGISLATQFPWLDGYNFAPFQLGQYVQPFVMMTLPNLFISSAVLFTVASLTRQALATYLSGLGLIIIYLIVVNQGFGNDTVENLADPFGIGSLQKVSKLWTPVEQESRLIGYPGTLLLNRAVWLTIAAGLLVWLYGRFSFTSAGIGGKRRAARDRRAPAEAAGQVMTGPRVRHAIGSVPRASRVFGARTRLEQTFAVARHALADVLRNRVFILVALVTVVLVFVFGWDVGSIVFDTSTWPVTHLIAGEVMGIPMTIMFTVLTSLVAGELVWKERDVRVGDIAAVTPVPDWVPLAGRFIALVVVLVGMQALLMASGIALQAVKGYYRFEPGLYFRILFGMNLVEYLIVGALAMAVHVVVNQKNLGHVFVVGTYLLTLVAGSYFGLRHNLLVFNGDPGWVYSDLSGFGPFTGPFLWFKLYWATWALMLVVVATAFWNRSSEGRMGARVRLARQRMSGSALRTVAVAVLLIVGSGGFIFYNTNVLNAYATPTEVDDARAAYERAYKRYEGSPQPTIVANALRVELYPERRSVDLRGTYTLVNLTGRPIDTVLVEVKRDLRMESLALGRAATIVREEPAFQRRLYALAQALQSGDSMTMTYHAMHEPRGFPNSGIPTDVVSNGTYFEGDWLPIIGYRSSLEIANEKSRERYGLRPRHGLPSVRDSAMYEAMRNDRPNSHPVMMDVVMGTAGDQIAVTSGKLVREWREAGRHYFHYRTDVPIMNGAPYLSARYAVKEDRWKNVPLRLYYHPTHTFNVDRIMHSMKASLEYYSTAFGPYQFSELRVVEFPRYANFARANPHTITFSEGSAFITRIDSGDVDRTFFVIAHETAHQWWGNQLRGARVKGVGLVSETLAQYSSMMVMEKTFGKEMVRDFYDFQMRQYLSGRAGASSIEAPMTEVESQPHLYYFKGGVVMYTLREAIGEANVNLALRRFLQAYGDTMPPHATAPDLIREFRAVTPDSLQYLITDLFETITLWELKTDSVSAEPDANGDWRVTLDVTTRKTRADSVGRLTETSMYDLLDIGVYADRAPGEAVRKPLYFAKHWVGSGKQRITVRVPASAGTPVRAGLDPDRTVIQREWGTPLAPVTIKTARRQP
ncbi:MAG TPA: M1 family aminopeptidase [Gemmatimonas sp.]|nr:M1 family aminopeptidase [Gemmatimonas sp.]